MALTQVSTGGVKDGSLLNADINASAAISKSKIENLINNNADNRVITGSGTANTLNAESNVVIDSSGNVGIGTSSPAKTLDIVGGEMRVQSNISGSHFNLRLKGQDTNTGGAIIAENSAGNAGPLLFFSGGSNQAMTINTSGKVGIGTSSPSQKLEVEHGGINTRGLFVLSTSTSYQSITMQSNCSRNTTNESYRHFQCSINGVADKMRVYDNGNIENTNNSYGSLSDETLKENIVDAGSQWDDIKNIRVRKFNFKSLTDPDQKTMLGVVAQEAELVCPNLITTKVSLQEGVEKEYKSFKYSVLYMKAIKCLQEAIAKIETLETKVAALEAA